MLPHMTSLTALIIVTSKLSRQIILNLPKMASYTCSIFKFLHAYNLITHKNVYQLIFYLLFYSADTPTHDVAYIANNLGVHIEPPDNFNPNKDGYMILKIGLTNKGNTDIVNGKWAIFFNR